MALSQQEILRLRREFKQNVSGNTDVELEPQERIRKFNEELLKSANSQEKEESFLSSISEVIQRRGERFGEALTGTGKNQTLIESILRGTGELAGAATDILTKTLGASIRAITPDIIEEKAKEAGGAFLKTPIGKKGLQALQQGVEEFEKFKQKNPRTAKNLEAVFEISSFFPAGKATQIGIRQTLRQSRRLAAFKFLSKAKILRRSRRLTSFKFLSKAKTFKEIGQQNKVLDIIKKPLSIKDKIRISKKGTKGVEETGILRKFQQVATPREREALELVGDAINPKKNIFKNIDSVQKLVSKKADVLQTAIKKRDSIFNFGELSNKIKSIEKPLLLKSDKNIENVFNIVEGRFLQIARKNGGKISSLLKSRKEFDNFITKEFGEEIFKQERLTPLRDAILKLRKEANNFIAKKMKNPAVTESLRQQNILLDTIENMAKKGAKEVDTKGLQRLFKEKPLLKKVLQFGAAGTIGGLLAD